MNDGVNPAIVVTDAAAAVSEDQPYADPGDADRAAAGAGLSGSWSATWWARRRCSRRWG
jgi:hypothetical protein